MSVKSVPFVETCHFTLVEFVPAAVNVAVDPAQKLPLVGLVLIVGALVTVSVAAVVVAAPQVFVNTARYCFALSLAATVKL